MPTDRPQTPEGAVEALREAAWYALKGARDRIEDEWPDGGPQAVTEAWVAMGEAIRALSAPPAESDDPTDPNSDGTTKAHARECLKRLHGDPPYDDPGNPCRGDGYYANSLEDRFGMSLEELKAWSGYAAPPAETGERSWTADEIATALAHRSCGRSDWPIIVRETIDHLIRQRIEAEALATPVDPPTGECEGEVGHWKEPVLDRAWMIEERGFYSRYVTSNEVLADSARDAGKVVTPVTAILRRRTPTGDAPGGEG